MSAHGAYQTNGIILARTNYGEADRILRILTPEHGKISAIAKGSRRVKSKAGGHLELLGEVALSLNSGRGSLELVTSARLVWYPHDLTADYTRLGSAFMVARAADKLTEPEHPTPGLYELVRGALEVINAGPPADLFELWFKLRLASTLGYRPDLSGCVACGEHNAATAYLFSPERGGLACGSDAGVTDIPITTAQIKFWRLLCDHDYGTISHITGAAEHASATLEACDQFYAYHIGQTFKPNFTGA